MILDARELENGAAVQADICIVGAGPAGITLALGLAGTGQSVCMLENGGIDFDPDVQDLADGPNVGTPYDELIAARLFYVGGSSNHWEGWCGQFKETDFERHDWIPYSGWPISLADLKPYYAQARDICDVGPIDLNQPLWDLSGGGKVDRFLTEAFEPTLISFSPPTRFGPKYLDFLTNQRDLTVYTYATALDLRLNDAGTAISEIAAGTITGKRFTVRAKRFVLAGGGIENPRMLLVSNTQQPAGIGNGRDLVGRFFMEHLEVRARELKIVMREDVRLPVILHRSRMRHRGTDIRTLWEVAKPARESLQVASCAFRGEGRLTAGWHYDEIKYYSELGNYAPIPHHAKGLWLNSVQVVDHFAIKATDGLRGPLAPDTGVPLLRGEMLVVEQVPNFDSRVGLIAETDSFGRQRSYLDWRISELDRHTVDATVKHLASSLGALDLGRLQFIPRRDEDQEFAWQWHHMGTTRMANDASLGVVDKDCRVFGVENLYMAGSSVFSTGGLVNPTLTIVALAARLADHLKAKTV